MSTAKRPGHHSLHLDISTGQLDNLPPVVAVFLILFDVKAGYTIAWRRSIPGCGSILIYHSVVHRLILLTVDIADSVEFKSLPSGLHNVREDLIYFVHDEEYAGISAFVNEPAAKSERNALMLAVGALVTLSQGRLGKSWKHASALKGLARSLAQDPTKTQQLEDFWTENQPQHNFSSPDSEHQPPSPSFDSTVRRQKAAPPSDEPRPRNRDLSTVSALVPSGQSLSPHHPARSLPKFVDIFGPLIFPLHRAALLRKRILLVGQAPVELACNFVYDISVISGIPASVSDLVPLEPLPTRLRPLFSVGVHDMQTLAQGSRAELKPKEAVIGDGMGYGWVACSTDDILVAKNQLYDTLVRIPPPYTAQAAEKVWPRVSGKRGTEIKATQRDLRRYRTLRQELRHYHSRVPIQPPLESLLRANSASAEPYSNTTTFFSPENSQETFDDASSTTAAQLAEPQSWSALAYSSFMWWASAGEKRTDIDEEAEHDAALLRDFGHPYNGSPIRPRSSPWIMSPGAANLGDEIDPDAQPGMLEMAIVAYFHRLTVLMLGTLSRVVEAAEDDEEDDMEQEANDAQALRGGGQPNSNGDVFVSSEDMARMGLDIWSEADRHFVQELVEFYWGRNAEVQGAAVECCGIRIC